MRRAKILHVNFLFFLTSHGLQPNLKHRYVLPPLNTTKLSSAVCTPQQHFMQHILSLVNDMNVAALTSANHSFWMKFLDFYHTNLHTQSCKHSDLFTWASISCCCFSIFSSEIYELIGRQSFFYCQVSTQSGVSYWHVMTLSNKQFKHLFVKMT